ncbi:hypothetical protein NM208_g4545 [Fusarium decemcellulare]|uniref:Uncharacterized protein n=2 Tax=Fusarium decemcellulare TaxID=57161 RepID=A0ACC1SGL2_9HYPO|nr:hypothetical protein NM208_g5527 [Fusarium decemcellulare]KAJ3541574.1 hypothetical protein NM208_g4545 [Fusarium decemcellulare]
MSRIGKTTRSRRRKPIRLNCRLLRRCNRSIPNLSTNTAKTGGETGIPSQPLQTINTEELSVADISRALAYLELKYRMGPAADTDPAARPGQASHEHRKLGNVGAAQFRAELGPSIARLLGWKGLEATSPASLPRNYDTTSHYSCNELPQIQPSKCIVRGGLQSALEILREKMSWLNAKSSRGENTSQAWKRQ